MKFGIEIRFLDQQRVSIEGTPIGRHQTHTPESSSGSVLAGILPQNCKTCEPLSGHPTLTYEGFMINRTELPIALTHLLNHFRNDPSLSVPQTKFQPTKPALTPPPQNSSTPSPNPTSQISTSITNPANTTMPLMPNQMMQQQFNFNPMLLQQQFLNQVYMTPQQQFLNVGMQQQGTQIPGAIPNTQTQNTHPNTNPGIPATNWYGRSWSLEIEIKLEIENHGFLKLALESNTLSNWSEGVFRWTCWSTPR